MDKIKCDLANCSWNKGLDCLPDNCARTTIHITQGAKCLSFISKNDAEERLAKAEKGEVDVRRT